MTTAQDLAFSDYKKEVTRLLMRNGWSKEAANRDVDGFVQKKEMNRLTPAAQARFIVGVSKLVCEDCER